MKEIKIYRGKKYIKIDENKLLITTEDLCDKDLSIVKGHLDVIEIDNEKYVTKDYKLLHKLTPELEKCIYKKGDLEDIITMLEDDDDTYEEIPEMYEKDKSY